MKLKYLACFCFALALVVFSTDFAYSQNRRSAVKSANWQTSVPEIVSTENSSLGIRDKWGSLGTFDASFVVTAPDKKVYKARSKGKDDEFVYVDFPTDFGGAPAMAGVYKVVFYVNGIVIGRDKFKYRP